MIKGGYYIKARCIQESEIAHAPPHVREIWDWLLKEANHAPQKSHGLEIERGQCLRTYGDILDGTCWYVGWRKMAYNKSHCETAMKYLKARNMITTKKTTRGMLVTICKYDIYQDPKSYETDRKATRQAERQPQSDDTINKNDKKERKELEARPKDLQEVIDYFKKQRIIDPETKARKFYDHYTSNGWKKGKSKLPVLSWRHCLSSWDLPREKTQAEIMAEKNKLANQC